MNNVDANSAYITGATLQLINKETEEIVFETVTEGEEIDTTEYVMFGKTYILHKVDVFGYELAEDIEFTVNGTKKQSKSLIWQISKNILCISCKRRC